MAKTYLNAKVMHDDANTDWEKEALEYTPDREMFKLNSSDSPRPLGIELNKLTAYYIEEVWIRN